MNQNRPKLFKFYQKPQADLWSAYYLEPAHFGLMVPIHDPSIPYPEDLLHTLAQYTKGELPIHALPTIFRQHPLYKTDLLDPYWRRRTRIASDSRKTVAGQPGGEAPPRQMADQILKYDPEEELIAYRFHPMPNGKDELVFCPRAWIHCWTHYGKWPTTDDVQPRYRQPWRTHQADWRRMGIKWHVPVRPEDIVYSHGFVSLYTKPHGGDHYFKSIRKGPADMIQALDLVRRYLPSTPKEALPAVKVIEELLSLDINERTAFLAPGYAMATTLSRPPFVHCTPDGRLYADRNRSRGRIDDHGQEEN